MSGNIEIANAGEVRNCCATLDKGVTYYKNLISELKNAKTKIQANWEGDAVAITEVITRIDQVTAVFEANVIPAMEGLSTSMVRFADESEKVSNNTIENSTNVTGTSNPGNGSAGGTTSTDTSKDGGGFGNIAGGALTGAGIGAGIGAFGGPIGAGIGAGIGAVVGGVGAGIDGGNTFENSFWGKHGNNFADAWTSRSWTDQWDYSECEGVLDVIGQTADGLVGTVSDLAGSILDTGGAVVNFVVDGIGELFGGLFG